MQINAILDFQTQDLNKSKVQSNFVEPNKTYLKYMNF